MMLLGLSPLSVRWQMRKRDVAVMGLSFAFILSMDTYWSRMLLKARLKNNSNRLV